MLVLQGTLFPAGKLTELIMGNAGLQILGKVQLCASAISARKAVLERLHATKMFLETQIRDNPWTLPRLKQLEDMWLQFGGYTQSGLVHIQEGEAEQAVTVHC